VEANPLDHLVLSNGLEMLHSELAARLAPSGMELILLKKYIWMQVFQLRKGVELQHVHVSATCDSLLRKENGLMIMETTL
jgi:hypothetical protein